MKIVVLSASFFTRLYCSFDATPRARSRPGRGFYTQFFRVLSWDDTCKRALHTCRISPISTEGVPHPGCTTDQDAAFPAAQREKYATYHDLVASNRCRFLVIAAGTGGRWSDDCVRLLRKLARFRAESEPPLLRRSMELAFLRRWWSLLSVALHDSIAAALDPSLDVAEGLFPVADAIDVWARDPPHTSVLGCPA